METRKSCYRLPLDADRIRTTAEDGRTRVRLPHALGDCFHDFVELEPGLGLSRLHYRPNVPLIEETSGPHEGRVMVITFGMEGRSRYAGQDATELEFQKGYTTITAFRASPGERRYEADETVSQLRVVAQESLIRKYVGPERTAEILGSRHLNRLAFRASTPATATHLDVLLRHLRPARVRPCRLDLLIHTLSLLHEQFNLLAPLRGSASSSLSSSDVERIEQACKIMNEQLDKPLTLEYLATTVGTNKNKLKDGMVGLYGCSPAELLLQMRMRKAVALLEAGHQVSQVAWQVGYNYANNFSVAFTRYHGSSPRALYGRRAAGH